VTCRESFENVGKWLDEIAINTSSNIVMVLVGNKIDKKEE
jgi:GTPase SAR1 family protein